jgi:hypothetical protein
LPAPWRPPPSSAAPSPRSTEAPLRGAPRLGRTAPRRREREGQDEAPVGRGRGQGGLRAPRQEGRSGFPPWGSFDSFPHQPNQGLSHDALPVRGDGGGTWQTLSCVERADAATPVRGGCAVTVQGVGLSAVVGSEGEDARGGVSTEAPRVPTRLAWLQMVVGRTAGRAAFERGKRGWPPWCSEGSG